MKQIAGFIVGFAVSLAIAPALAEDFTAGKTPAQLFRSDCSTCHHSPNGLVKDSGDVRGLTAFLREHYTTKSESAAALAAYVSGLAGPGASGRSRGAAQSATEDAQPRRTRSRLRSDTEPAAPAAEVPESGEKQSEEPPSSRRRRGAGAAEGEKRRRHDEGDAPRPPRGIGTTSRKPAAAPKEAPQQEASDPITRLRDYLSSGLSSDSAKAGRSGAPKARKRRSSGAEEATPSRPAETQAGTPPEEAPAGEQTQAHAQPLTAVAPVVAAPAAEPAAPEAVAPETVSPGAADAVREDRQESGTAPAAAPEAPPPAEAQ